jgi:hypothetical protein
VPALRAIRASADANCLPPREGPLTVERALVDAPDAFGDRVDEDWLGRAGFLGM